MVRWLARAGVAVLHRMSVREVQRLGDLLGWFMAMAWPSRQRLAERNIARVFGDRLAPAERRWVRLFCTHNAAKTVLELLRLPTMTDSDLAALLQYENLGVVDELLAEGKGLIIVTAHYGNWELLAAGAARRGYPVTVVARDTSDPETASVINSARESAGLRVIGRSQVRRMLTVLKAGEILGILPDQYAREGGVTANFMGRRINTPAGPAVLALRTGAPILPGFARRNEDDRTICHFGEPIRVPDSGDRAADVLLGTQLVNDALAREILRRPGQWLWLHDRWRDTDPQRRKA